MRIVVDANVFVSAVLKADSVPFFVVRWIERNGQLLRSVATEREVVDVIERLHIAAVTTPSFRDGLARMLAAAELVTITERVTACRDPRDDKFLEPALNGKADLVVSGDSDLLALNPFRGIPIVRPASFARSIIR